LNIRRYTKPTADAILSVVKQVNTQLITQAETVVEMMDRKVTEFTRSIYGYNSKFQKEKTIKILIVFVSLIT
jgi:hypothetical protein